MRVYVTFCSEKKFPVRYEIPKFLYDSRRIKAFVKRCEASGARFAILSGKYGVVWDEERVENYNRWLGDVDEKEYKKLILKVEEKLKGYEVFFYEPNPHRAKKYRKLLEDAKIKFESFNKVDFILKNERKNHQAF